MSEEKKALEVQVGGNHYKNFKIQPIEFIQANKLGYEVGNVIKYVTRYQFKNGKQDLEKAIHYIKLLMEHEYPEVDATVTSKESFPNGYR